VEAQVLRRGRARRGSAAAAALLLACALAGTRGTAAADEPAADGAPPLVHNMFLHGPGGALKAADLAARSGIRIGAPLRVDQVRAAIKILYAIGAFRSVEAYVVPVGPGQVDLFFAALDRLLLSEIVITGHHALDRDDLVRAARLPVGSEVDEKALAEAAERIRKTYVARGFHAVAITSHPVPDVDPSRVKLLVQVVEGEPTLIESISFSGRAVMDARRLIDVMPLKPGDRLDVTKFHDVREKLREVLRLAGWYDAVIREPVPDIDFARHRSKLTVPVNAGLRYAFAFDGNEVLGDLALQALVDDVMQDDEKDPGPLDAHLRGELVGRVKRRYEEAGFLLADVRLVEAVLPAGTAVPSARPAGLVPEDPSARYRWEGSGAVAASGELADTRLLRFVIDEGRPVKLSPGAGAVAFTGNAHFKTVFLRTQLLKFVRDGLAAVGGALSPTAVEMEGVGASGRGAVYAPPRAALAPLPASEVYVPELFDEAARHLVDLYRSEGYWDATIDPPAISLDTEAGLVSLTFTVHEGDPQFVREVLFDGAASVSARTLLTASALKLDAPLDPLALEAAREKLLRLYTERLGFLYAEVDYEVARIDPTTAVVVFRVVEGVHVKVKDIVVKGADHTKESVIRSRLTFEPGDDLNVTELRESERALGALGLFLAASVEPEDIEVPEEAKTVVVTVIEDKFGSTELSWGYSTDDGPRASFRLGWKNFFGLGWNGEVRVQANYPRFGLLALLNKELVTRWPDHLFACPRARGASYEFCTSWEKAYRLDDFDALERRINLAGTVPGAFRLLVPFDFQAELIHSRRTEVAYGLTDAGVRLSVSSSRRSTEVRHPDAVSAKVETDFFYNIYVTYNAVALTELPVALQPQLFPDASVALWSLRPSLTLNFTDDAFNPTKGMLARFIVDYVHSVTDGKPLPRGDGILAPATPPFRVRALRLEWLVNGFIPLGAHGWGIDVSTGLGTVLTPDPHADAVPPDRAFFLGGRNSIRGFFEQGMLPWDVVVGGTASAETARVPARLYFLLRSELHFPLFGSGFEGVVFLDAGNSWADVRSIATVKFFMRLAPGVALRYGTPVGPLSLAVGYNLTRCGENVTKRESGMSPWPDWADDIGAWLSPCKDLGEKPIAVHLSLGKF
jgi:outer membrane protein assembly factor BamA